jgi:hypothetical protein
MGLPPDISALFFDDEDDSPAKARALAQALGGQQRMGQLGMLTGDKVLSPLGQQLMAGAGRQSGMLAQLGEQRREGSLRQAMDALKAKREVEINARELAEKQAAAQLARQQHLGDTATGNREWDRRNKITAAQHLAEARAANANAAAVKDTAAERGTIIPGLEKEPGAAPTAQDATKVKASLESARKLKALAAEMRQLHKDHGTELTGPVATRMKQIHTAMKIEGKNIAELGALSGPDTELMEGLTGEDPTSLWSNTKGLAGGLFDNTQTALDGLDSWADNALQSTKKTMGYRDAGKRPAHTPTSLDDAEEAEYQALTKKYGGKK